MRGYIPSYSPKSGAISAIPKWPLKLCSGKDYGKKFALYVRRRTEPAQAEVENCAYSRQPQGRGWPPNPRPEAVQSSVCAPSRSGDFEFDHERIISMLYTIAVVLIILWLLGLVTSYTMGGFIHVLLVIAIVVVLLRVISGRNPL
jgi:hypothetical protein